MWAASISVTTRRTIRLCSRNSKSFKWMATSKRWRPEIVGNLQTTGSMQWPKNLSNGYEGLLNVASLLAPWRTRSQTATWWRRASGLGFCRRHSPDARTLTTREPLLEPGYWNASSLLRKSRARRKNDLEGIVAKWKLGTYQAGHGTSWVKIKNPSQINGRHELFAGRAEVRRSGNRYTVPRLLLAWVVLVAADRHPQHAIGREINAPMNRTPISNVLQQCPFCDAHGLVTLITRTTPTGATFDWRCTNCFHEWSAVQPINPSTQQGPIHRHQSN